MKPRLLFLLLAAAALLFTLPSENLRSQENLPLDVLKSLDQVFQKNTEIIKKQEETMKIVEDLLLEARQARIYSKRG